MFLTSISHIIPLLVSCHTHITIFVKISDVNCVIPKDQASFDSNRYHVYMD